MINIDTFASAMFTVMIILMIVSVPTIFITVRSSAKTIKRYMLLRSVDKADGQIPTQLINEWSAVKTPIVYISIITEELEKLNGLKNITSQCTLAILISIVLWFCPGYEKSLQIPIIIADIISILTIIYGRFYRSVYKQEYLRILKETSEEHEFGAADSMYG
ncbi:hypothetical protein [Candidatus Methanarcanum hacksteinii]|uniref:hypothetical protein n=1 Tax=Candidatus Methanarcanum hacksteinii TaxID=2911857 RepID=UPI0015AB9330|nr:MAG: hypothetical protein A3204_01180 [Candidatus Methanarcanum hacksteinii]